MDIGGVIRVGEGKDKPVRQRHPWIFSGAVASIEGSPQPGAIVDVTDLSGRWLARGYYNPKSQIVVRLLTWDEDEAVDSAFWRRRLERAVGMRRRLGLDAKDGACRLVYAESDGIPGLIVDRYGDWLAVQFLTLGVEARRDLLLDLMTEIIDVRGIYEKSDPGVRALEGIRTAPGCVRGVEPPGSIEILENGLTFSVGLAGGQKTGFYLDQRENRRITGEFCAGRRVLNAFSFTGAFGVYALRAGASFVTHVDSSFDALTRAETNLRLNGFDPDGQAEAIAGDVFQVLRSLLEEGRLFDLVVLDPPKFARSKADLVGATRGYKDINMLAMRLLSPGGILSTFSCSGLVDPLLFQKVIFGAALDVRRDARIVVKMSQAADHPILLTFPEAEYLKGLLCEIA